LSLFGSRFVLKQKISGNFAFRNKTIVTLRDAQNPCLPSTTPPRKIQKKLRKIITWKVSLPCMKTQF